MYGLEAIQQANGWAMAGAGACIVLAGLSVLSFLISLLPRITGSFEGKPKSTAPAAEKALPGKPIVPERFPDDVNAAATLFATLTEDIGDAFSLVDLHRQCKAIGIADPHLSIKRFRDAGVLIPIGDDRFSWQHQSE